MYLGIDLGTSGVKAVLIDEEQRLVDQQTAPLTVQRPQPLWSEQDPESWWRATLTAVGALARRRRREFREVAALGLSGQMHGATLLDANDRVLRPAILWNDGRSGPQCAELERREPRSREITGNLAMPGFTAPKLLWVAEHEPDLFARTAKVLLPKDYLRLRLTGSHATDLSDASGTLWLDVGARRWSDAMLEATGLGASALPELFEGTESTGALRGEIAADWGMDKGVAVAAGGGDQAAGAAGAGVIRPGDAFLSLGTSGVYFVAGDAYAPDPDAGVHAFCHCVPGTWHQMSVILSAAASLSWVAATTGAKSETELLAEVEAADRDPGVLFLPYLSGERTPHNDPQAKGVFFGLHHGTTRADLGRAVLEGVAFALADGQQALLDAGAKIERVCVIGGGSRSAFWGRILASSLGRPLDYAAGAELGPAFGAARLARLAATGEDPRTVCEPRPIAFEIEPDPELRARYAHGLAEFRRLYRELRDHFADRGEPR